MLRCDRERGVITELWISLGGAIDDASDLGELILAAPPAGGSTSQRSCNGGAVVQVTGR
jgi:hypothetical protein